MSGRAEIVFSTLQSEAEAEQLSGNLVAFGCKARIVVASRDDVRGLTRRPKHASQQ